MQWVPISNSLDVTADRKYRITRAVVDGGDVYTAWKCVVVGSRRSDCIPLLYTRLKTAALAACLMDPDWRSY